MKDNEFYEQILGLREPWEVLTVDLDMANLEVRVRLGYKKGTLWVCPESQEKLPGYDHVERSWQHLDTCGFKTILSCSVPRIKGPDGKVSQVSLPWAEKGSRFTILFECFAIAVLEAAKSIGAASQLTGLSWDQLQRVMERAVERGRLHRDLSEVKRLGLDEKSFTKGQHYISVLCDVDGGRVLEVVEGRDQEAAELLIETLPEEILNQVEAVCIDMSAAFDAAVRNSLPGAAIVNDRFHISQHLNDAVAKVHREENVRLQKLGDDRLKGTQRLFGYDPDHFNDDQALRFEELRDCELKTSRAWSIKEMFRHFWDYTYEGSARKFFKKWFGWATRSQLKPMVKVAKMIKKHFENIITYLRHRITNAVAEGLNSKIQSIKASARGFRSVENYRTRILFFCGKLDLYPL